MSEKDSSDDTPDDRDDTLDADDIESEQELMFGYGGEGRKPMDLMADYLPDQEDYGAKTVLTKEQVHLLAGLEQLVTFYPEIQHREKVIIQWIAAYEKRMTSVHGLSRDQFLKILVSMNGGSINAEGSSGILEKVLKADMDLNEDE